MRPPPRTGRRRAPLRFGPERNSTDFATTSIALRFFPSASSQELLLSRPSTATRRPFERKLGTDFGLPVPGGDADEVGVAVRRRPVDGEQKLATFLSSPTSRTSTSVARFPISVTLFMRLSFVVDKDNIKENL